MNYKVAENVVTKEYQIKELSWERVFLNFSIETERMDDPSFSLRRFDHKRKPPEKGQKFNPIIDAFIFDEVPLEYSEVEVIRDEDGSPIGKRFNFTLNITAVKGNTFLDNGKWEVQVSHLGETPIACSISYDLAYKLEEKTRVFKYDDGKYSYDVSFSTYSPDDINLGLILHSHFMIENNTWHKKRYVQEAHTFKGKLKRVYLFTVVTLMRLYYKVVESLSPKKGNRIMFMTETKPYLWGNLKYIDERMKERGLDKDFRITYNLRNAVGNHKSALSWAKLVTRIARQDYIFVDDYVPIFGMIKLSPRTKLIQVWHAGEGFKSVGYSRFGKPGSPHPTASCHKQYDYVVTGSKRLIHVYSEVFGLPEDRFFPIGMARLDGFLDPEKIKSFKDSFYDEYPMAKNKKLILFCPTFRGVGQSVAYYDYHHLDFKRIYDFCGEEYVWAFKMHPFVTEKPPIPEEYKDRILDLSKVENINDLYYVTEIMIPDYSSAYFEFALMEKPVLFFTYDREAYELTRGVHKSVKDEAPGKVCDSFDDLMKALETRDYDYEKTRAFREANFSNYDGNAADKIIDSILLNKKNS